MNNEKNKNNGETHEDTLTSQSNMSEIQRKKVIKFLLSKVLVIRRFKNQMEEKREKRNKLKVSLQRCNQLIWAGQQKINYVNKFISELNEITKKTSDEMNKERMIAESINDEISDLDLQINYDTQKINDENCDFDNEIMEIIIRDKMLSKCAPTKVSEINKNNGSFERFIIDNNIKL